MKIFIGYDPRESMAFHVLCHSIMTRTTSPVEIIPLVLKSLPMWRTDTELCSTEFSFSRFLVPYLSNYEGWSLFMDCDMLVMGDIRELFAQAHDKYAVMCVKHDYVPKDSEKFLGAIQTKYQKKNWSSVMLFNNAMCRELTPDSVNNLSGLNLHQFKWLAGDHLIGELPREWNHLVGEYPITKSVKNVHYTVGGPWFEEYKDCDYSQLWFNERDDTLGVTDGTNV